MDNDVTYIQRAHKLHYAYPEKRGELMEYKNFISNLLYFDSLYKFKLFCSMIGISNQRT